MSLPATRAHQLLISTVVRLTDYHGLLYRYEVSLNHLRDLAHWDTTTTSAHVNATLWLDGHELYRAELTPKATRKEHRFELAGHAGALQIRREPDKRIQEMVRQRLTIDDVTIFDV